MRLSKRKNTNKKYDLVYIITKLVRLVTLFLSMVTMYLVCVKPIYTYKNTILNYTTSLLYGMFVGCFQYYLNCIEDNIKIKVNHIINCLKNKF